MDRRDSIKSLLVASLAGGALVSGCNSEGNQSSATNRNIGEISSYGRTDEEKARDEKLHSESFFSASEIGTIAILCDLILPVTQEFGSATDAGVPEFIEFIAKDMTQHQLPLRGGIMWLNQRSNKKFDKEFSLCSEAQQKELLDEIAYPDEASPEVSQGVRFFTLLRNLTLTGYYTSEVGIKALGYQGNVANQWDGVPDDVLAEHGFSYDNQWKELYVDHSASSEVAKWDEEGELID